MIFKLEKSVGNSVNVTIYNVVDSIFSPGLFALQKSKNVIEESISQKLKNRLLLLQNFKIRNQICIFTI